MWCVCVCVCVFCVCFLCACECVLGAGTDPTCYDNRELSIKDLRMCTSTLCAFRGVVWIPVPEKLHTLLQNEISTNLCCNSG